MNEFVPHSAIHPGETLAELLDENDMSNKEFALRTGKPEKTISLVVNGKSAITPNMAVAFEKVLGLNARFWMSLQRDYEETLARISHEQRCEDAADWARDFPYAKMVKLGWVPKTVKAPEKAQNLFDFFQVSSESAWHKSYVTGGLRAAYRLDLAHNPIKHSITAWLRKGEIEAGKLELPAYSSKRLKAALPGLKKIMARGDQNFYSELNRLCAHAGVCILLVPNLPGAPIHGSSRWLKGIPVIQLSVRYKKYDRFWFTLFHEIAHIILHGSTYVSLEIDQYDANDQLREKEADDWAAKQLFSDYHLGQLKQMDYSNPKVIKAFAAEINTHPSIVVGRLQKEQLISYSNVRLNNLHISLDLQ